MSNTNAVIAQLFDNNTVTLPKLGKEVVIKKVTLRTMNGVLELITTALEGAKSGFSDTVDLADIATILKLISNNFDKVVEVAVSLSSVTKDELLDMEVDESALILQAILLLNKVFFTTKVLLLLEDFREAAEGPTKAST